MDPRERQRRLLERFLTATEGFALGVAVAEGDGTPRGLFPEIRAVVAVHGVDLLALDLGGSREDAVLLTRLQETLEARPPTAGRAALWLTGLGAHLDYLHGGSRPHETDLLATANLHRDLFVNACPVPVLLWVSSLALPILPQRAPDLWHCRSETFDFTNPEESYPQQLERAMPRTEHGWQHLPAEDAARQRALLERLLDEPDDDLANADPRLHAQRRARLLRELVKALNRTGDWEGALQRGQEAITWANASGNERLCALAWGDRANVLAARGQWDEALRIRQEEELPVYQRLEDVRATAVTMGQIANILVNRGQLDEALRILRDEALPALQHLGEVRSTAITMGRIADILADRGQLDEALRIRQEEELPVYQRLGDVHAMAVTMGKIAGILADRGQFDEALRILRDEVLPTFQRLGDVRSAAIVLRKIAAILEARGEGNEARRLRQPAPAAGEPERP